MEANHKKILKAIVLELRHMLEGYYDGSGWHAGDLEQRLNALGVWRDRDPLPADELAGVNPADSATRKVVDAYLKLRDEAGVRREEAVAEFVRETAYTWANRLLALRCMEARELIDEVVLQKEAYGGRSLEHNRLAQRHPELCASEDDGLFAMLDAAFAKQAHHLPLLFEPKAPGVALKPGVAALKRAIRLLSGTEAVRSQEPATTEIFRTPDAFGWAYQYWNTEEKDRVFAKVRTEKGAKIEGAEIIPATQLYTEPYMVKFLVQNSLGTIWAGMHPQTELPKRWEYFAQNVDGASVEKKSVREITFLDPACGSGHFLLEAFDLFYGMYEEEGEISDSDAICRSILEHNLYGIDIDERAIQISEAALWMKAAERVLQTAAHTSFTAIPANLISTNIRLPKGVDHLKAFLDKYPEDKDLSSALEIVFAGLENADELGSLLQIEGPVERKLKELQRRKEELRQVGGVQTHLYKPTPIQGQLPVGVESYDEWKEKSLGRIKQHFLEESEATDIGQAFFVRSARRGLRLFDLVARRYDVVAANPPYLGTKKQGQVLKSYLDVHYENAQYDLYAAFLVRARDLLTDAGLCGLVTRSTWLFQKWYARLRDIALDEGWLRLVVALGSGAFEDFGGDVVDVTMVTMSGTASDQILGLLLQHAQQKAEQLRLECTESTFVQRNRSVFRAIPGFVINFDITPDIVEVFTRCKPLKDYAEVTDSVVVVSRFLRFWWERPLCLNGRWMHYSKGGSVEKWLGFELYSLDWENHGIRLKSYVLSRYPASKFRLIVKEEGTIGRPGITWTTHASGRFGARRIGLNYIVSSKGPGVFAEADLADSLLGLLNCSISQYLLKLISPGQEFGYKYVGDLPVPELKGESKTTLARDTEKCVQAKAGLVQTRIIELSFNPRAFPRGATSLGEYATSAEVQRLEFELALLQSEYEVERAALAAYKLSKDSAKIIYDRTGPHPWDIEDREVTPAQADAILAAYSARSDAEDNSIDSEEAGEDIVDEEDVEPAHQGGVTQDTTLGTISAETSVHPTKCYDLVRTELLNARIRPPLRRDVIADFVGRIVLTILGHRWLNQIEADVPVPVDAEGIIPLTDGTGPTLLERMRKNINSEFDGSDPGTVEREFTDIMTVPLEHWLTHEYVEYHIRQFKKRPIAWQVQSSKYTARRKPAFSVLIYYHKIGAQTLTTIQSQYLRPLRQRYETEMRGIESVPQGARSDRQQDRLRELVDLIAELRQFDDILDSVSRGGFGPDSHHGQLRQYGIEDAMFCLKSRWLDRLSTSVSGGPCREWKKKAENTKLHSNLAEWVSNAMGGLSYHCSSAGPNAPKQETLDNDPTAADLAVLISANANKIISRVLELACAVWWRPLDGEVFAPLRFQIKEAKDELKILKREDVTLAPDPHIRQKEIEVRVNALKESIKRWRRDLDEKTEKAEKLRDEILAWTCPEARTWEPWLASQPMYDAISGVDGLRQAPKTVADFVSQESAYVPDINDGVRVNIAPLQKAGLLAADVLAAKDVDKAIADRAEWRADERRWCREGKLPQPGWWPLEKSHASGQD